MRAVLWARPRSPRAEAGPLKGSPVSVRLRPGARIIDHGQRYDRDLRFSQLIITASGETVSAHINRPQAANDCYTQLVCLLILINQDITELPPRARIPAKKSSPTASRIPYLPAPRIRPHPVSARFRIRPHSYPPAPCPAFVRPPAPGFPVFPERRSHASRQPLHHRALFMIKLTWTVTTPRGGVTVHNDAGHGTTVT